ncbi:MAG: glycosyltransferase, partial [Planctomycetota bacterium]|nr:glycosyltransferase [Planctomycetota bacterium]
MDTPADRSRILLSIPVFNEARYIENVLSKATRFARDILVIDDGSSDETPLMLAEHKVEVIRH